MIHKDILDFKEESPGIYVLRGLKKTHKYFHLIYGFLIFVVLFSLSELYIDSSNYIHSILLFFSFFLLVITIHFKSNKLIFDSKLDQFIYVELLLNYEIYKIIYRREDMNYIFLNGNLILTKTKNFWIYYLAFGFSDGNYIELNRNYLEPDSDEVKEDISKIQQVTKLIKLDIPKENRVKLIHSDKDTSFYSEDELKWLDTKERLTGVALGIFLIITVCIINYEKIKNHLIIW